MPLDRTLAAAMDPIRLRILALCERQPRSLAELAAALELSTEVAQHHVRVLVDAELLSEAEGRYRAVGLFDAFADEPGTA